MRQAGSIIALSLAVAIVYLLYRAQYQGRPERLAPPKEQIDLMGVRGDLFSLGQAERLYLARNGRYASLEELKGEGLILFSGTNRRGYEFTAVIDEGRGFKITASPADKNRASWPTLSIDQTLQIAEE